jgi:hypothetical protein
MYIIFFKDKIIVIFGLENSSLIYCYVFCVQLKKYVILTELNM